MHTLAVLALVGALQCTDPSVPPGGFVLDEFLDQPITLSDGETTTASLRMPRDPAGSCGWPLVVFIHGLFGTQNGPTNFARDFAEWGYATLTFDVDPSTTANQMISILENNPLAGTLFTASLVPADGSPNTGAGTVDVNAAATLTGGVPPTLTGADANPSEVEGVFTALVRLRDALRGNDVLGIERAIQVLDDGAEKVNFSRAELGARQKSLDVLQARLDAEEVDLQASLSLEIDVDITEAISNFTARQASYQASLQTAAQTLRTSLLDYL